MHFSSHCNLCEHKIARLKSGYICELTQSKPDFINTCDSINLDKTFQEKIEISSLKLEIVQRTKKATYKSFLFLLITGLIIIVISYILWLDHIKSIFVLSVLTAVLIAGFTFISLAFAKLSIYKRKLKKATLEKDKNDKVLEKYGIRYSEEFIFQNRIHGIQEVLINLSFKNWKKVNTSSPYKINN